VVNRDHRLEATLFVKVREPRSRDLRAEKVLDPWCQWCQGSRYCPRYVRRPSMNWSRGAFTLVGPDPAGGVKVTTQGTARVLRVDRLNADAYCRVVAGMNGPQVVAEDRGLERTLGLRRVHLEASRHQAACSPGGGGGGANIKDGGVFIIVGDRTRGGSVPSAVR
jgi:hypothetical protein